MILDRERATLACFSLPTLVRSHSSLPQVQTWNLNWNDSGFITQNSIFWQEKYILWSIHFTNYKSLKINWKKCKNLEVKVENQRLFMRVYKAFCQQQSILKLSCNCSNIINIIASLLMTINNIFDCMKCIVKASSKYVHLIHHEISKLFNDCHVFPDTGIYFVRH